MEIGDGLCFPFFVFFFFSQRGCPSLSYFVYNIFQFLTLWQLTPISVGDNVLDLVVIGCGPAGLALAAESAKLGLNVGLIGPDLPFTNNYGVWEDEFKGTTLFDHW